MQVRLTTADASSPRSPAGLRWRAGWPCGAVARGDDGVEERRAPQVGVGEQRLGDPDGVVVRDQEGAARPATAAQGQAQPVDDVDPD